MNAERLALLAAAATGIQVGAAIVATRLVVHEIGPATIALLRYGIGVLCLLPFAWPYRHLRPAGRDLAAMLGLGAVQFGALIALLNVGLRFVDPTRTAMIFATFPLLTMLLAVALRRERAGWAKAGGVLVTIAGVAISLGHVPAAGDGLWIGTVVIVTAASCGAVAAVLSRPYLVRYPTTLVGVLAMFGAIGSLAPIAAAETLSGAWPGVGPSGWLAVGFIGVSSGVGYWLWLWALKHTTPTRVTVFLALSPLTAALLGVTLFAEPLRPATMLGIAAVAIGLWLAVGPPAAREARAQARRAQQPATS